MASVGLAYTDINMHGGVNADLCLIGAVGNNYDKQHLRHLKKV